MFLKKTNFVNIYPYKLVFFRKIDLIFLNFFELNNFVKFRSNYRGLLSSSKKNFLVGFVFLVKHLKFWVLPLALFLVFFYFSIYMRSISFFKLLFAWFLILNVGYWIISGFVFFIKKYKYNRFTSAIQRFWRRSFIIFWLIESSLFAVFIYLLFNASQEQVFAFDLIQLNKTRLYSWKFFVYKSFFVVLIIMLSYFMLVCSKWNIFSKLISVVFCITAILTYILWLEFYQFFYVLNWYGEISWFFDAEDKVWYAEGVFKRARIVNHYVTICVIAKFWHIVFIYLFWVFFVLRSLEQKKISYILLSVNLQNFLILYVMNWLLMYPWFKFISRKFLTFNHRALHEFREYVCRGFYYDFILFYRSIFNIQPVLFFFKKTNFFYSYQYRAGLFSFSKDFIKYQLTNIIVYINIFVFSSLFFSFRSNLFCFVYILLLVNSFLFFSFLFFPF